jgi:hypothetical protein
LAARVERLVSSLVGITDVRLAWTQRGTLQRVHLVRHPATQQHQLVRNVVSGLKAAFGIELDPSSIQTHENASTLPAPVETPEVEFVPVPAPATVATAKVAVHASAAHPAIAAAWAGTPVTATVVAAEPLASADVLRRREHTLHTMRPNIEPIVARPVEAQLRVPRAPVVLDHIDVERAGNGLRCRIALTVDGRTYPATAEAPDGPMAEPELAARVALDALRAAGVTGASLHGIGMITIADCNYLVATVRDAMNSIPRAGAVPLHDSMAWSAALAVLRAAGTDTPVEMRPAAGSAIRTAHHFA